MIVAFIFSLFYSRSIETHSDCLFGNVDVDRFLIALREVSGSYIEFVHSGNIRSIIYKFY